MKKNFKRTFLFSLLVVFSLVTYQKNVVAAVASEANNKVTTEIVEDWEPKETVDSTSKEKEQEKDLPKTSGSTGASTKKSGILPQTGEEKAMFMVLIGLSLTLVIMVVKATKERKFK